MLTVWMSKSGHTEPCGRPSARASSVAGTSRGRAPAPRRSSATNEMNMDKVESVQVDQSILGRMLDYGTVTILGTAATAFVGARERPVVTADRDAT
jgi:hypothetical protein